MFGKTPAIRLYFFVFSLLFFIHCSGRQSVETTPQSSEGISAESGRDGHGQGATSSATVTEVSSQLMNQFSSGDRLLTESTDPTSGVIFIRYFIDESGETPEADEEGVVRIVENLCGAELNGRLEELQHDLLRRSQDQDAQTMFACSDLSCSHGPERENITGRYTFIQRSPQDYVLASVVHIESRNEDFIREAEAWAEIQIQIMEDRSCGREKP